jgi:para-aminobenzoate synthetase component 1
MIRVAAPALEPAEALRRLSRGARPFLLDGALDADGLGAVSWGGCDPDDGVVWSIGDAGDPLALLDAAMGRWRHGPVDEAWPFAVGWISYDAGAEVLARACGRRLHAVDDLGVPDVDFARYRAVWKRHAATGKCEVLALDAAAAQVLLERLSRTPPPLPSPSLGAPRWAIGDDEYRRRVVRVLEYLRAGDVYQVNLSHRLRATLGEHDALPLYLRLRAMAPAPLGAYLSTETCTILCNSPELFLRARANLPGAERSGILGPSGAAGGAERSGILGPSGAAGGAERSGILGPSGAAGGAERSGIVETRPIKGTRRRGVDAVEDARLAAELRASDKDKAEHLMIVDLLRNDLGRVARTGSVTVDGFERLISLPTVHHLVSTVRARTPLGLSLSALLAATLPGGSITGAPKLRAVEIIDELEGVRRGVYCGALGWLGPGGACDLALAIRTAVARPGELVLGTGGGIVADSLPDDELAETRVKAEAFIRALA